MKPLSRPRTRNERGVYAILYALLTLTLLSVAAIVVDLSLMREGRATTRSAADSAAVAAASSLNPLDPSATNPRIACETAWRYLRTGLSDLHNGSGSCSAFPVASAGGVCPAAPIVPIVATSAGSRYTVRITWPVTDGSGLMTQPDVAPGSITQSIDTVFDGQNPCDRIGVEVLRVSPSMFASALGIGSLSINAASVGRAIQDGESNDAVAALNILEVSECGALSASGQGGIQVEAGGGVGFIAVESNGRDSESTCNGQSSATIEASTNNNNFIRADGPGGPGTGLIQTYALNPSPTGNPGKAYNSGQISPTPAPLTARYGTKPVLRIFNCTTGSCAPGGADWINQLRNAYGGGVRPAAPWSTATSWGAFKTLTSDDAPGFTCNTNSSTPPIIVPAGNWYIDCPGGFNISGLVVFKGGHVVSRGPIELGSNTACLAINVPAGSATCPTADTNAPIDTTTPAPSGDAILYIQSGRLYKTSQAQLYLPQTFTYLQNGHTDLGGGSGALLMTTPLASNCDANDAACRNRHFRRMVLWSEGSNTHAIGGQSALVLRGVLFTPNALSTFTGQSSQSNRAEAQFWTRKLDVGGQAALVMAADPDAAIARPLAGVSLIR